MKEQQVLLEKKDSEKFALYVCLHYIGIAK